MEYHCREYVIKRLWAPFWVFSLDFSWIAHSGESQLPCREAALWKGLSGEGPIFAYHHMSKIGSLCPPDAPLS